MNIRKRQAYLCEECKKPFLAKQLRKLEWVKSGTGRHEQIACKSCNRAKIKGLMEDSYVFRINWND